MNFTSRPFLTIVVASCLLIGSVLAIYAIMQYSSASANLEKSTALIATNHDGLPRPQADALEDTAEDARRDAGAQQFRGHVAIALAVFAMLPIIPLIIFLRVRKKSAA